MHFPDDHSSVTLHSHRQFITGEVLPSEEFLPDSIYSQALDALIIGCADVIPVHNGQMLIGRRNWEPQPDWWCFGGRMRKGELYQIAAARNVKRELFQERDGIEINSDRFNLVGIYNLIWDKRAQEPAQNGCHVLSITMMLSLTDTEVALLQPNEEYQDIRWILPDEIIQSPHGYHPCLVQMTKDLVTQTANT